MNPAPFLRRLVARRWFQALGALVLLYAATGFLLVPALVKAQLPKRLAPLLHRPVSVARVRANPFALSLTLDGFSVLDKDGSPLVGWDRLYVNLSAATLFRLAPVFQEIRLEGFHAHVVLDKKGNPTFADLLEPSPEPAKPAKPAGNPPDLRIQRLTVVGARVEFIDHATSQPFATTLGPLSLDLDAFRLSRDSRNPYTFEGRTERGETFGWEGHFLLDPLRSQGTFHVGHVYLPKYAPFYRDAVAFAFLDGSLDFKAAYEFQWAEGSHVFRLHQGEAGLDGLKVAEAGKAGAAVELPEVRMAGLEADLLDGWAKVASLALRNGKLDVRRDADGTLNLQRMAKTKGPKEPPPEKPFRFELNEFKLENQTLVVQDLVPRHPVNLTLDQMGLTVKGFSLDPAKACGLDLDLRWNGKGHVHAAGQASPMKAAGALDLKVEGLDLPPFTGYLEPSADVVLAAGRLGLSGHVDFDAPKAKYAFKGQAQVDGFKAEDGPGREPLVGWDSLRVGGIQVATSPMAVTLASVDWDGPSGRYILTPKGTSNVVAVAVPKEEAPAPANPLKAEIGVFRFKRGAFTFIDRSIQPIAALSLDGIEGQVGRLSSDPAARADLQLKARVDGVAALAATGTVNLLAQTAFTDLKITMGGMDLSPLSPYAAHYVGYGIEKGKLELELAYLVQEKRLQASNHIRMDQFTLGEAVDSPEAVHLPVKLGLALLRDRHGIIDLDVPVGGDLAQPDFKLSKVIWHAVLNLFGKIATSPFALLGKVFGGGDADLSLVAFPPGADTLDPQGVKVLETLEKGLFERPGLRLEMEGTADETLDGPALKRAELDATLARLKGQPGAPQERPALLRAAYLAVFPPPKEAKGVKPPPEPAPAEMEARLLDTLKVDAAALKLLARRRVQGVRDRLLQTGKVEEGRVFIVDGTERAKKEGGTKVFFELK